jgi:nucleotide-binding universal stress UspA family protein
MTIKKHLVLCPVDDSGSAEPAIRLAADLAKIRNSKIVVFHVIEPGGSALSMDKSRIKQIQQRIRGHQFGRDDIEYEFVTRLGDPAKKTIEYAKQHAVDLIVMGTHGRTGLASLVVGSVAKKVMANAHCPVVTVKLPSMCKVESYRRSG